MTPQQTPFKSIFTNYRWVICALLFVATTINYLDRLVISVLSPQLEKTIGWTKEDWGNIGAVFTFSYAIGLLVVGRFMDKVGTRAGFSIGVVFWSLSAMAHALARNVRGFMLCRGALGIGEAANFPACVKTVAEWFPKKERALATGIFNAGTNIGAIIAPIVVPRLAEKYGWQYAFISTGCLGFMWVIAWLLMYRKPEQHPSVSREELDYIRSDPPEANERVSWGELFRHKQTWAFAIGKFLTDPIWYFYIFWLPGFFYDQYKLNIKDFGPPLVAIYVLADVGSIGGGWISSSLIKRGKSVNFGRKIALLICALCVVPIAFSSSVTSLALAVAVIGLAAAAHQGWSANLFTLVSDTFPRRAVASVVGIGGFCGSMGGSLFQFTVGKVVKHTNNYAFPFICAGCAYLTALLLIHLLVPRLGPAQMAPSAVDT